MLCVCKRVYRHMEEASARMHEEGRTEAQIGRTLTLAHEIQVCVVCVCCVAVWCVCCGV
jgi:hypothetical protein